MNDQMQTVDCRWLLALYAIIPVSMAAVLVDLLWFDAILLNNYLPAQPERWPLWTVLFGLPHIIASMLTMADREYLGHYRHSLAKPLLIFAAIATAGYLGPQPFSKNLLFIFLAFYTIYHVLAQQLGLTLMMMGTPPTPMFRAWKWLAIFAGFAIYIMVYGERRLGDIWIGSLTLYDILAYMAGILISLVIVLTIRLASESRHTIGTYYLWGNVALIVSAFLINEIGYSIFVIIMPRIIHDLTAYTVYITHDSNRNRTEPRNIIYSFTRFSRLPVFLLLPLLSIGIAYALTVNQHHAAIAIAILTVSFLHYYFEGFIWRGDNPHRQHLGFKR